MTMTDFQSNVMDASGIDVRSWRGRVIFSVVFFVAYYGCTLLGYFVHLVVGYGLMVTLLGGVLCGIYLSPLSVCYAWYTWRYGVEVTPFMEGMVSVGGMIMPLGLGIVMLLLYSRLKGFTSRFLALLIMYHNFLWMAIFLHGGAAVAGFGLAPSGFDVRGVSFPIGVPYGVLEPQIAGLNLAVASIIVGLGLALWSAFVVIKRLIALLQDYFVFRGKTDLFLALLLLIGVGRGLSLPFWYLLEPAMSLLGLLEFAVELAIIASVGVFILTRGNIPDMRSLKPLRVPRRAIAVFSLLAIVTTAIWLGLFGPSADSAHGITLHEFPGYCNVSLEVGWDQTLLGEFSYRPPGGPQVWRGVREHEDWGLYGDVIAMFMAKMFNTSQYDIQVMATSTDDFWMDDAWASGGARLISVQLDLSTTLNWQKTGDTYVLTIHDPWTPGFLDAINITSTGYSIVEYAYEPMVASDVTSGSIQEGYLLWLNSKHNVNPETYVITFNPSGS